MKKRDNPRYGTESFHGFRWAHSKGIFVEDFERKIELTKRRLNGKIVLDVGCSSGKNVFRFSNIAKEIHGIEVRDSTLNQAKERNNSANVFFKKGDAENIPYGSATFDVIYSLWVLEHLRNPSKFFDEVYRVLKPGGLLILWAPSVLNPTGVFTKLTSNRFKMKALSILNKKSITQFK